MSSSTDNSSVELIASGLGLSIIDGLWYWSVYN